MKGKQRWGMLLFLGIVFLLTGKDVLRGQEPLKLEPLIRQVLEQNPDLRSAEARWRAAEQVVPQAGALPDPTFTFSLANLPVNSFALDQEPMTGKKFALMQMIPFPGKLGLKEDIAEEDARIASLQYQELRNRLVSETKQIFFSLFFVDRAIEVVERNKQLMEEFVKIAQAKYSVGKGLQQDVLKAQVELSKLIDRLLEFRQKRQTLEARLNALLNRPAGTPVPRTENVAFLELPLRADSLKQLAREKRPLLAIWQSMIQKTGKMVALARKDYLPNFSLGVAYTQREVLRTGMGGTDYLSGSIGLNIPLYFWRKQSRKVEEMQLRSVSVREKAQDVENQVLAMIDRWVGEVETAAEQVKLFKSGIIPQATQALQASIAAYQTDKVDFLTMLSNQITLFNYEMGYYRVLSSYWKGIAQLEYLVGETLVE